MSRCWVAALILAGLAACSGAAAPEAAVHCYWDTTGSGRVTATSLESTVTIRSTQALKEADVDVEWIYQGATQMTAHGVVVDVRAGQPKTAHVSFVGGNPGVTGSLPPGSAYENATPDCRATIVDYKSA